MYFSCIFEGKELTSLQFSLHFHAFWFKFELTVTESTEPEIFGSLLQLTTKL